MQVKDKTYVQDFTFCLLKSVKQLKFSVLHMPLTALDICILHSKFMVYKVLYFCLQTHDRRNLRNYSNILIEITRKKKLPWPSKLYDLE